MLRRWLIGFVLMVFGSGVIAATAKAVLPADIAQPVSMLVGMVMGAAIVTWVMLPRSTEF